MGSILNYWLFFYQAWIVIAILFLLIELTDGSLIVCLPLGIGASIIALFISIFNKSIVNEWYFLLLIWVGISAIISYLLTKFWKKEKNTEDINKY